MTEDRLGPHGEVTYNVETNAYHANYHLDDRGSLLSAIIDLVSLVTGKEPETMTPLYDIVDADAMEALFQSRNGNAIEVTFQYTECEVVVRSSGDVAVVPLEKTTWYSTLSRTRSVGTPERRGRQRRVRTPSERRARGVAVRASKH